MWRMGAIGNVLSRCQILILAVAFVIVASCEPIASQDGRHDGGYLFAHMTNDNYGKLFYSISRDGYSWEYLNQGEIIFDEYLGHPNIVKGPDDVYYMIGVSLEGDVREPILYRSKDLVSWYSEPMDYSVFDVSSQGFENESVYLGAPKIFYDSEESVFMITWHAFNRPAWLQKEHWESMRTFYVLTKDWEDFSDAKLLFDFPGDDADMATIDTYIVKDSGKYYAVMKDERWPETNMVNGKRIRIAVSDNLTGPYSAPGSPISEQYREAPVLISSARGAGWMLFIEDYHARKYELLCTESLEKPRWELKKFNPPLGGRHGCVLRLDEWQYQYLKTSSSFSVREYNSID